MLNANADPDISVMIRLANTESTLICLLIKARQGNIRWCKNLVICLIFNFFWKQEDEIFPLDPFGKGNVIQCPFRFSIFVLNNELRFKLAAAELDASAGQQIFICVTWTLDLNCNSKV